MSGAIFELFFTIFFYLLLVISGGFSTYYIPTHGMEPTLKGDNSTINENNSRERVLVEKFSRFFRIPKRGEIVVYWYYPKQKEYGPKQFIHRVIGLPGEKIEIKNGKLLVNGAEIKENYILEPMKMDFDTLVPPDCLFLLGDNRNNSADSRFLGNCPFKNLIGLAILVYYPPENARWLLFNNFQ